MDKQNTIFGWVLFSGIVGLGLAIVSGKYFHADNLEAPENPGYFVAGAAEGGGGAEEMTMAAALNMDGVDVSAGEAVFAKCTACHTIEQGGANGIGPNLYGIMGKDIASLAGFAYSDALSAKEGAWTWDEMNAWLKSPRGYANGTKMSFAGLSKIEDRAAVALYMNSMGSNIPVPEYVEAVAAEAEGAEGGATDGEAGVEGGAIDPVEAAEAMDMAQPVPGNPPGT
ncbi:c-type cytochrome [Erythrobacter litoralis]|uniref:Cytochrome C n=1 Tax=Erythrobacter litoralis (strain HTCC2594) TaxID=314225 RepID=Q2N842_ERYLH|nr:cytochrome c family protein [Erythrobacter litoralis]ABC64149.1 cytochrome C [Erythrobacter litoralis HTCC2594]